MNLRSKKPSLSRDRNRAPSVSGRPSQAPYSYSSRRSEEAFNVGRGNKPKPKVAKAAQSGSRRIGLIILLLVIVVVVVKVLSLSSSPDIKFIGHSSDNALTNKNGTGTYAQAAESYLSSSIWNGNKLTLDSSGLVKYLTDKYPELSSVSVSVPFLSNHLVVYLSPTSPAIILAEPNAAYALDSSGRVILSAVSVSALNLNLPVVTDQSGLSVGLGKRALTGDDVHFIEEVVGQLEAKSYKISTINLPAGTDELDVYLSGQPYFIKFNLNDNDPRQQAGTFLALIATLKSQNAVPAKYVDVRVDGRAYYQ